MMPFTRTQNFIDQIVDQIKDLSNLFNKELF